MVNTWKCQKLQKTFQYTFKKAEKGLDCIPTDHTAITIYSSTKSYKCSTLQSLRNAKSLYNNLQPIIYLYYKNVASKHLNAPICLLLVNSVTVSDIYLLIFKLFPECHVSSLL